MNKIKSIWTGKLALIMAMAFTATACQQDDIIEQYNPKPQGEYISFNIQRGWDYDQISRSAESEYGDHVSGHILASEDQSQSMGMKTYQQGINTWFDDTNSRGTMITQSSFKSFRVYAYKSDGSALSSMFVSEHRKDDANGWNYMPTNTNGEGYYWPGANYTCSFYGIALSDGKTNYEEVLSNVKTNAEQVVSFDYTVPNNATDQPDIMVAAARGVNGAGEDGANLNFKHILTAVNIKVGVKDGESSMPNGKIKSIKFKNIYGKGTYSFDNETWTGLREFSEADGIGMKEYSIDLGSGYQTNGINSNTQVNAVNATFMMIPQTLHKDAMIEIVYHHENTNRDATISAPLSGMSWPKATEINYLISISGDGELKFTQTISTIDAHYVIAPFTIANNLTGSNKTWRLKAEILDNDGKTITISEPWGIRTELSSLQEQGYWTYNEFGDDEGNDISRKTTGDIQLYAFIPENATYDDRNVKLSLYAGSSTTAAATMSFKQLGLNSANGERIEETGYVPWGFKWDSDTQIVYTIKNGGGRKILTWIYDSFLDSNDVISLEGSLLNIFGNYEATINLGNISTGEMGVESSTEGFNNTEAIYNFGGLSDVADFKATLDSWEEEGNATLDEGSWPVNPNEFAARTCVMKNRFKKDIQEGSSVGQSGEVPIAVLENENYVWYLPASGEYAALEEAESNTSYALQNVYWTSTAPDNNNSEAYTYTVGKGGGDNAISLADRSLNYPVRAKRVAPTATTN